MTELKRLQVGDFNIKDSVSIEELEKDKEKYLIPFEELFKSKEIINIKNDRKLQLLLNGAKLTYNAKDEIYRIYNNEEFIGIGIIQNNLLKRDIIL